VSGGRRSATGPPDGETSLPTGTAPRGAPSGARTATSRTTSGSSVGGGRFVAGTVLRERYRILGLLGRGGMGEVYRADDLLLDQALALKFLPESLAEDPDGLERFYGEVRIARQISHPAVCRTHDLDRHDGQPFLTFVLLRFGLLTTTVGLFVIFLVGNLPLSARFEHWASGPTYWVMGVVAALALSGFRAALGNRSLLGEALEA